MDRITNDLNITVNSLRNGTLVSLLKEKVFGLAADLTNKVVVEKLLN